MRRSKAFWIGLFIFGTYALSVVFYILFNEEREKSVLAGYAEFLKLHVWQLNYDETVKLANLMLSSGFIIRVEVYQVFGEGGVEKVEKFCDVRRENLSDYERMMIRLGLFTVKRYDEKNFPALNLYYESLGKVQKIGFVRFYVLHKYFYFYSYAFLLALMVYMLLLSNMKLMETKRELEKTNEELNATVEELENTIEDLEMTHDQLVQSEKMASIGRIVANISHDINTPAGIIYTSISELKKYIESLKKAYEEEELTEEFFEEFLKNSEDLSDLIEKNVKKIADLVRSLKTMAMYEAEGKPMKFNMKELLDDIVTALNPKIRKTKVNIHVNCPDDIEIKSFPSAISQIITNLIENSIMHAFDNGEIQGNIWIDVRDAGSYIEIDYRDDGKGMDEETKRRAFEPFYSTKIGKGGTGLGLAIVYSLVVDKLGGDLVLESEPGHGTRFVIMIPKVL